MTSRPPELDDDIEACIAHVRLPVLGSGRLNYAL